jgi:CspA family cold shock protein
MHLIFKNKILLKDNLIILFKKKKMSSSPQEIVPDDNHIVLDEVKDSVGVGEFTATCKWFNDKLGFGFVTICNGADKGKDIFVHHSGIKPLNSIYKTLKKGEYINFNIINGLNGLQAVDVTGINGGPLMCDHVIGKKMTDFTNQQPIDPNDPPPPPPPYQWQNVQQRHGGPRQSQATGGQKRYPPNSRPYKKKLQTSPSLSV